MKRILIALIGLMAVVGISKADDRPIKFEKLPAAAQQFVKTNFADNTVVFVTKDDDLILQEYTVVLVSGVKVVFENSGALEKVEAKKVEKKEEKVDDSDDLDFDNIFGAFKRR